MSLAEFSRRYPHVFWTGTLGAAVAGFAAVAGAVLWLLFHYSPQSVREYSLILSPWQWLGVHHVPSMCLVSSVAGASALVLSARRGQMRRPTRVALVVVGGAQLLIAIACSFVVRLVAGSP